jgi:ABC-type oligopeptide transport system ATPase subunit
MKDTTKKIIKNLNNDNMVEVVGFHLCGKSTLSETLHEQIKISKSNVLLQNAQKWIHSAGHQFSEDTQLNIDTEIKAALNQLSSNSGCWIIDDAEIMLAHASERIISHIDEMLRKKKIHVVLIRNRFVSETQGWFHDRKALLNPCLPGIEMKVLDADKTYDICTSFFYDERNRYQRSEWLTAWSGGIPGLIYELYRFTPEWPHNDTLPDQMQPYIQQVSQHYLLHYKTRSTIISALFMGLLPPRRMLSDDANIEIGYLILIGMISSDLNEGYKFQGKFWEHVARSIVAPNPITQQNFDEQGLGLELLINSSGLGPGLCDDLDLSYEEGRLAEAFSQQIFCSLYLPELVISVSDFLIESLGRIGLRVLISNIDKVDKNVSAKQISEKILLQIGIHS